MADSSILTSYPRTSQDGEPPKVPANWPDNVVFLQDYYYHPAINPTLLDVIRTGAHLLLQDTTLAQHPIQLSPSLTFQSQVHDQHQQGGQATSLAENQPPPQEQQQEKKQEKKQEQEQEQQQVQAFAVKTAELPEDPVATAYLELPLGDAIPGGILGTLDRKTGQPLFEIQHITTPASHPVLGGHGLFACQPLRPGTHLLDYIAEVAPDAVANPDSDHTLYLMADLNLDASFKGNHARFVNDFRGIRPYDRGPNLGWDLYRDRRTGQVRMAGKVLKRIGRGEEILCTYGKAFWRSRGIKVHGNEWEDAWDTDLDDWTSSEEDQKEH